MELEKKCLSKRVGLGIVGSRSFESNEIMEEFIGLIMSDISDKKEYHVTVVSGGAKGVDSFAEQAAMQNGLNTMILKPKWDRYGKVAGYERNKDIWRFSDVVIAFWDGSSKGTEHTLKNCLKEEYGVSVLIVVEEYDGDLICYMESSDDDKEFSDFASSALDFINEYV